MYTKIHLQLDKSSNEVEISFQFIEMFIILRVGFIPVSVCNRSSCLIWDLKGFALSKFDRKTFPSYSSSALYVSIPGYYFSIILIDFLIIQSTYINFISKMSGWNFWQMLARPKQTTQPELFIYSYIVSVSVKQLYKS